MAAATATSGRVMAMGAVVSAASGTEAISDVRVAVSSSGARTSRWVSVAVHGTANSFAWVLPVKPSAFVDLASDAWLESLENATAPRIVPPDVSPCGEGGLDVEGTLVHVATTAPTTFAVAADATALLTTLNGWGLAATSDLTPLLDAASAEGDSFVAMLFRNVAEDTVTRTVRIVDTTAASIPLGLTSSASARITVTAYALAKGAIATAPDASVPLDGSLLLWQRAGNTSTYASVVDAFLVSNPNLWLVATANHDSLFEGEPIPGSARVPAVSQTYFSLASAYGDATDDPSQCGSAAAGISTSNLPVGTACPAGAYTKVGNPSCAEETDGGEVTPDVLRCGGIADDLAIALSGMVPETAWLTRAQTILPAATFGVETSIGSNADAEDAGTLGPVWTCWGYASECPGSGDPPPTGGSSGNSGSANGGGNSGSGSSGSGNAGSSRGSGNGAGSVVGNVVAGAVQGAASSGCGGDSSDGSGDSCGGDSSSDSSSGSCGGDSSGDSGGGCSGDSGGGSTDCSFGRGAKGATSHRHSSTSRVLYVFLAMAAIARRCAGRSYARRNVKRTVRTEHQATTVGTLEN